MNSKQVFNLVAQAAPRTVRERYLFIVDNDDLATALMVCGYNALATDVEYSTEQLIGDLNESYQQLTNNKKILVPCLSRSENDRIIEAVKGVIDYETDGYKLFYNKAYLKQPEYQNELAAAVTAYIEEHTGHAEDTITSPEALEELQKEYETQSNAAHLQSLIDKIKQSKLDAAISTGFENFDKALKGGLYNERLYVVAAVTSLGKTTFVQSICDNIAHSGKDVLYFSLEMSRFELMAKSISRHTYLFSLEAGQDYRWAKTALDIMAGAKYEKYSKDEKDTIEVAMEQYALYSDRITTFEGVGDIGVKDIRAAVKRHKELTGRKPVVIIDYLQILAPKRDNASDKQNADYNILELKRLARDEEIPVICVSSINRTNYLTPIDLEAIKESGNIEFTADTIIGLQFNVLSSEDVFDKDGNIKKKRELINEARAENPRKIDAVLLKNRQGETGSKVLFDYYPAYNYFAEEGGWKPAPKNIRPKKVY